MYAVRRTLWRLGQMVAVVLLFYTGGLCIGSLTAVTNKEATVKYSDVPSGCVWVAIAGKTGQRYYCHPFGTPKDNPVAFLASFAGLLACLYFLWISGKPNRGFPFGSAAVKKLP